MPSLLAPSLGAQQAQQAPLGKMPPQAAPAPQPPTAVPATAQGMQQLLAQRQQQDMPQQQMMPPGQAAPPQMPPQAAAQPQQPMQGQMGEPVNMFRQSVVDQVPDVNKLAADLTPFARGFLRGCLAKGLDEDAFKEAAARLAAVDPEVAAELAPLTKEANIGRLFSAAGKFIPKITSRFGRLFGRAGQATGKIPRGPTMRGPAGAGSWTARPAPAPNINIDLNRPIPPFEEVMRRAGGGRYPGGRPAGLGAVINPPPNLGGAAQTAQSAPGLLRRGLGAAGRTAGRMGSNALQGAFIGGAGDYLAQQAGYDTGGLGVGAGAAGGLVTGLLGPRGMSRIGLGEMKPWQRWVVGAPAAGATAFGARNAIASGVDSAMNEATSKWGLTPESARAARDAANQGDWIAAMNAAGVPTPQGLTNEDINMFPSARDAANQGDWIGAMNAAGVQTPEGLTNEHINMFSKGDMPGLGLDLVKRWWGNLSPTARTAIITGGGALAGGLLGKATGLGGGLGAAAGGGLGLAYGSGLLNPMLDRAGLSNMQMPTAPPPDPTTPMPTPQTPPPMGYEQPPAPETRNEFEAQQPAEPTSMMPNFGFLSPQFYDSQTPASSQTAPPPSPLW